MKQNKSKFIIFGVAICLVIMIIIIAIFSTNKPESTTDTQPLYSDTTLETFSVTFLTEDNQTNKDDYTNLFEEYKNLITNNDNLYNSAVMTLNFEEVTNQENGLTGANYDLFKSQFPAFNENVIRAELYKRGYIVRNNIITRTENFADILNTYTQAKNFKTIDKSELRNYGIKAEEIERYFAVRKTTDNMILLADLEYSHPESSTIDFSPKAIYVFGKVNDEIILYGVYPLRHEIYDYTFLDLIDANETNTLVEIKE